MIMIFISVNRNTSKYEGVWGSIQKTDTPPPLSPPSIFFNKKANRQKAEVKQ